MCLAVPMKIVELLPGGAGVGDLDGARHEVDLSLVPQTQPGQYVIVHAGFAIEVLDEREADARLALFAELARMQAPPDRAEGSP